MEKGAAALLLGAALILDVKTMRIPNWLTLGGSLGGVVWRLLQDGWPEGLKALAACAGSMAGLLGRYAWKGIGAGDVKLFGALGAWLGFAEAMRGFVYSVWIAGGIAAALMLARGRRGRPAGSLRGFLADLRLFGIGAFFRRMIPPAAEREPSRPAQSPRYTRFPFMLAVFPGMIAEMAWGRGPF